MPDEQEHDREARFWRILGTICLALLAVGFGALEPAGSRTAPRRHTWKRRRVNARRLCDRTSAAGCGASDDETTLVGMKAVRALGRN